MASYVINDEGEVVKYFTDITEALSGDDFDSDKFLSIVERMAKDVMLFTNQYNQLIRNVESRDPMHSHKQDIVISQMVNSLKKAGMGQAVSIAFGAEKGNVIREGGGIDDSTASPPALIAYGMIEDNSSIVFAGIKDYVDKDYDLHKKLAMKHPFNQQDLEERKKVVYEEQKS